ncbi:carbohydrate esterase family 4 protein [Athelia psychrophila]|uniref:chitin deacetylase n=1 Tax=Athelia psychrophila TaxID=1759441 RepID=A0A166RHU7_9AGAM|nr:carbohydrate esterase family 4 protein [Fibularhizoctonia sp. CBS 109695]
MVNGATILPRTAGLNRTTEAQEAAITNPTTECSDYTYEPVEKVAKLYPANWEIATILANDTEAKAAFALILPKIPTNISVKGKPTDSETGTKYSDADPDCWWTYSECTTPKLAGLPNDVINVPEPNTLGYGFDDGPDCAHNAFYNFLTAQNQKATMFYIGSNVQDYPLEAQRAITDGHEICIHTWTHQYSTALTNEQFFAEIWYTMKMIKLVTGVTPQCWRPPYGDIDDRIRSITHAMNLTTIVWSYDSNDWSYGETPGVTTGQIDNNYNALIKKQQAGAFNTRGTIILTHELTNFTMSEAIKYHPLLAASFSHLVPVGVAYNWTQPYVETNYALPSFAQYAAGTTQVNASTSTSTSSSNTSSTATGTGAAASSSSASGSSSSGAVSHTPATSVLVAMLAAVGGALIAMA